jgi:hypothetical protein
MRELKGERLKPGKALTLTEQECERLACPEELLRVAALAVVAKDVSTSLASLDQLSAYWDAIPFLEAAKGFESRGSDGQWKLMCALSYGEAANRGNEEGMREFNRVTETIPAQERMELQQLRRAFFERRLRREQSEREDIVLLNGESREEYDAIATSQMMADHIVCRTRWGLKPNWEVTRYEPHEVMFAAVRLRHRSTSFTLAGYQSEIGQEAARDNHRFFMSLGRLLEKRTSELCPSLRFRLQTIFARCWTMRIGETRLCAFTDGALAAVSALAMGLGVAPSIATVREARKSLKLKRAKELSVREVRKSDADQSEWCLNSSELVAAPNFRMDQLFPEIH